MYGQGSPSSQHALHVRRFWQLLTRSLLIVACANVNAAQPDVNNLRLQIAWGGKDARLWRGFVEIKSGNFSQVRLLGLDADQPGSFVLDENKERIWIQPRFARRISGLEVTAAGTADAELSISLTPDLDTGQKFEEQVPLGSLAKEIYFRKILGEDQKIRIARAAGDKLRVRLNRESLVCQPGDRLRLDVLPHELDVKPGSTLSLRMRLQQADAERNELTEFFNPSDDEIWDRSESVKVDESGHIRPLTNIEVPVPDAEGVYDVTLELAHRLPNYGLLAQRKLQFVVIDSRLPPIFGNGVATEVTSFNPSEKDWLARLTQLTPQKMLPRLRRGPWGNQDPLVWEHHGQKWTRIRNRGWVAYSLPVTDPGIPHVVEVQFPADFAQEVGVSIVEPDAAGQLVPISFDSGISIGDPDLLVPNVSVPRTVSKQRLVFWPMTNSPVILISNQSAKGASAFGSIRLEAFPQGLPADNGGSTSSRKRIAMMDGNYFKNVFLAKRAVNDRPVSFDDWRTFHQAASRLIAYLRYAGYDGVTLRVAGRGSTLYPSELLQPTPEYDQGIFANTGQDPFRKDVLEMILQMFDREGLAFIPAIDFATPLPELETLLAKGEEHLELVDAGGRLGVDRQREDSGQAAYYNPLDQRVQLAMRHVVEELVDRYSHHSSFAGVHLHLVHNGFSQLPDTTWPFDEKSVRRFHQFLTDGGGKETISQVRQELASQLNARQQSDLTDQWLTWRSQLLTDFYGRLGAYVRSKDDDHSLYLGLADLALTDPWERHLQPTLLRNPDVTTALRELGIDLPQWNGQPGVVVLRPQRIAPISHLHDQAINLEVLEQEVQQQFVLGGITSSQFLREVQVSDLEGFAANGPQFAVGKTELRSVFAFVGPMARRPFARSLAVNDDRTVFDGGDFASMGQESSLREFFDVYRHLPAVALKQVALPEVAPLVVRLGTVGDETFGYAVNPSPWPVDMRLESDMTGGQVTPLGSSLVETTAFADRTELNCQVGPYGLMAFKFDRPDVTLTGGEANLPSGIAKHLRVQLDDVRSRVEQIKRDQSPLHRRPIAALRDPGFETPLSSDSGSPWTITKPSDATINIDRQNRAEGDASLHLRAVSKRITVTSHLFATPTQTGSLFVLLKLRSDRVRRAPLEVRLDVSTEDRPRVARIETQISQQFTEVGLRFTDVPVDPDVSLKFSLEMVEAGDVWIDDVQVFDRWFEESEQTELMRWLLVAYQQQQEQAGLANLYDTLNGYWPRFLLRYIEPLEVADRPDGQAPGPNEPEPEDGRKPFLERWKKYVPRIRPLF